MKLKLGMIIGLVCTGLTIYKIKTRKIGPCSPEREQTLNSKGGE